MVTARAVEDARREVRPEEAIDADTVRVQGADINVHRYAELAVVGKSIVYPECLSEALTRLTVDDLFDPYARSSWAVIVELTGAGAPLEFAALADKIAHQENFNKKLAWLIEAQQSVDGPKNLGYYLEVILSRSRLRHLVKVGEALSKAARDSDDPSEVAGEAERMMREVQFEGPTRLRPIAELVRQRWQEIEHMANGGSQPACVPTGIASLDGVIGGGFSPGQLWILAARPAMGKSAFALQCIESAALAAYRSLVFSLEMQWGELVDRFISGGAGLPTQALKNGAIPAHKWPVLAKRMRDLSVLPFELADPSLLSIDELRASAQRASLVKPPGLIVVDYLQLLKGYKGKRYNSQEHEISDISRELKRLAKDLACPVLALAQLNRDIERRPVNDRVPRLSDLRNSGQLEQDADGILGLHRPSVVDEDADPKEAIIGIIKQRSGPTCRVTAEFEAEFTRFSDVGGGL